jgi:hypothetical protein
MSCSTKAPVSVGRLLHNKCLNDYVVEFLCSTITPKAIDLNGRLLITFVIFLHKQYGFVVFSIFCFCFCRSRPCLLQLLLCSVNKKQKAYPFCLPKSFNDILYLFNLFTHLLVHHHLDRPYIYRAMNRA